MSEPLTRHYTYREADAEAEVERLTKENARLRAALEPLLLHFEVRVMQYGRAGQGQRYVSPNHFYFPSIAQIDTAREALGPRLDSQPAGTDTAGPAREFGPVTGGTGDDQSGGGPDA